MSMMSHSHLLRRISVASLLIVVLLGFTILAPHTHAQAPAATGSDKITAQGTVPDEATRAAVLAKLRELYGADKVLDQITVGGVVTPPNWSAYVQKLLSPQIKQIKSGQLKIDGTSVSMTGDVANEAQSQQIASDFAKVLGPSFTVRNGLRSGGSGEQNILDQTLANRIVEFESGSANLTPKGLSILDEMSLALNKLGNKQVLVIGHTDNLGIRANNVALSKARAEAVKAYLVSKGATADNLNTDGIGPDKPVANNATPEGRARNRRIEFRVS
jgi:OmpA-OmpF porin, OOP family